jgi:oligopeptide transport system substrate-binding protein
MSALGILTVACGGGGGGGGTGLAAKQILHFPVFQDPKTWDPDKLDAEVDSELVQNVFDNLWRFDNSLTIVPDLATTVPTSSNGGISADELTYTVHLKQGVKFSNGDPFTSKDVLYSWNRAVALRGPYSSNLSAIDGFSDVRGAGKAFCAKGADPTACATGVQNALAANDPKFAMKGLTAPDDSTVSIKLSSPCGWCLAAWSLQASTGSIVDHNAVASDPLNWWSKPAGSGTGAAATGQIGTGAYKMTEYIPKQSIKFVRVSNWWGTPKPTLTEVDLDIKDASTMPTAIAAWEQGTYDIDGYGGNSTQPVADILRIKGNSRESKELLLKPKGRTTWVSFNIGYPSTDGPFVGESAAAKGLRKAFTLAVDKKALASTVCHDLLCAPATGGLITKGLVGYLGDNSDPLGKFDAPTAKQLLAQYDPDGSKTKNLKYSYNAGGLNDPVATFLQSQWQTNLGISVQLDPHPDASAFIADRLTGKYVMSRDGWQFDYNHPQDWYDNLWGSLVVGANTSGYADPTGDPQPNYDSTLAKADGEPIAQALPLYTQLATMEQNDVAYLPLYYSVGQFLIHSYVKGAGSTAQADYYWDGISIISH